MDDERYVDFNRRPLSWLEFMFVSVHMGTTSVKSENVGGKEWIEIDCRPRLAYSTEK